MDPKQRDPTIEVNCRDALERALGYLNFSSGIPDARFLAALNEIYGELEKSPSPRKGPPTRPESSASYLDLRQLLEQQLDRLQEESTTFQQAGQARSVIAITFDDVLGRYLDFHRDLLFHQSEGALFRPFFVGRVFEAVLSQGGPWDETDRIATGAFDQMDDFIGHRPVAALETQKMEPYRNEWCRPLPLYIRDVGLAVGIYHDVVEKALDILQETDPDILRAAYFSPEALEELAIDIRAYDFDHPVNKRPNYHFGQWDPHCIDNKGQYTRYVVQQVTLDALMQRLHASQDIPVDQLLFEAGAVLAGTILMGAGISGAGPDSHDSLTSLGTLMPHVAGYRDAFYSSLIEKLDGEFSQRLTAEESRRKQPFGACRQHLNAQLSQRRAAQLKHVYLAQLYAKMGFVESAMNEANKVAVPSARVRCRIDCDLVSAQRAIHKKELEKAADLLDQSVGLLQRGIECGALVDPWNIIGFDTNFTLFPALENSIPDHRVDELLDRIDRLFSLFNRIWAEAAATNDKGVQARIAEKFEEVAGWWHRFATHEVSGLEMASGEHAFRAAQHVAKALRLWHGGGASAGDAAFWAPHAKMFDSARAYSMVIDNLLDRRDYVAAMALLVHWLSRSLEVELEEGEDSFVMLSQRWLEAVLNIKSVPGDDSTATQDAPDCWPLVRKYFDYLEANADEFWTVPRLDDDSDAQEDPFAEEDLDDEEDDLFSAAYEDVVYRDTTDDGVDHSIFDRSGGPDELEVQTRSINLHLLFLHGLARSWKLVAVSRARDVRVLSSEGKQGTSDMADSLKQWLGRANVNRRDLAELMRDVSRRRIATPRGDIDSLIEYDRQRLIKETLLERIFETLIETVEAARLLAGALGVEEDANQFEPPSDDTPREEPAEHLVASLVAALLAGNAEEAKNRLADWIEYLQQQPLLYVPLSKGGSPVDIVRVRIRQRTMHMLLTWLPRMGLISEARQLIETARLMERNHGVGAGAVTEFDQLFEVGYRAMVESLVDGDRATHPCVDNIEHDESRLVSCLEGLTEAMLLSWLAHSRTLRLSVLERVRREGAWKSLVDFIRRYGSDLFTQSFLSLGNLRGILHQGVENWIETLREGPLPDGVEFAFLEDLDTNLDGNEAVEYLSLVLEAVIENYNEYRDYNSTTTQSDRGEMIHTVLDFMRLQAEYNRVAWNLRPVVTAHDILVRRGLGYGAEVWRHALVERIGGEADRFIERLTQLQNKYSMQMPTIADHVHERFVQPMCVDKMRALVQPTMSESEQGENSPALAALKAEIDSISDEMSGAGLDPPNWLLALEEEVHCIQHPDLDTDNLQILAQTLPAVPLRCERIEAEISQWDRPLPFTEEEEE